MNKKHILDEIRRAAKANGGVPLGRLRFFTETGIKESDWYGKYWARWSDAVREAGLAPNQKQKAYSDELLIGKLIAICRELGHFPVSGDLRLKAHEQGGFPSDKTFRRLGPKSQLVSKVAEHCREREGFEDVLAMCKAIAQEDKANLDDENASAEEIGVVYLLKAREFYKIGRSNALGRRERELAIQLPEKANTVHVIRTDDPVGIEAYWHKRFESKR
ncbi:MAG: GIY-YIG nuclease family protein [Blastocatellia bacterium]